MNVAIDDESGREAAGVEIVSKAAAVIGALEKHGELTAQQIADCVGEPVSSTYRLLTQLSSLGWVERGLRRGLFRLGLLIMRIGGAVEDRIDIRAVALPAMMRLHQTTGETSLLCVRRGERAVCIERLEGGEVGSLTMRIGDSRPLHLGAAPMAILAFLPRGDRDAYLEHLEPELRETVSRDIDFVRARGFSVSDAAVTPGIAAMGAPVYNHRGELEASFAVSGLRHPILSDSEETATRVLAGALETSSALGLNEDLYGSE